jgi:hypothetical protein
MKSTATLILLSFAMSVNAQLCDPNTYSLLFNGNSYVSIGADNSLNISDKLTLEAWIYPTSWGATPDRNSIICKHGWTQGEKGYALRAGGNGQLSFNIAGIDVNGNPVSWQEVISPAGSMQLNHWYHVAGTFDGDKLRLYIDGSEVANRTFHGSIDPSPNYNLNIGRIADMGAANGRYFYGLIDEVRVWEKKRSANDLVNNKDEHINPQSADLVGYWQFNEGSGSTTMDLSSRNNTGTLINTSWNIDVPFTNGILRPIISESGGTLYSSSLTGNQWNLNGMPIPGATGISLTPATGGLYSVTADYGLGCEATSEIFEMFFTKVTNAESEKLTYTVHDGKLVFLTLPENFQNAYLNCFTIEGKCISGNTNPYEGFNFNSYGKGLYLITLYNGNQILRDKVIIY